jgi:AcrR family transcriptional regulator
MESEPIGPRPADPNAIVDAFLLLLSARPFGEIGLDEIAKGAGISLGNLRDAYDGKISILKDFVKRIDKAALSGWTVEPTEETTRDRLFDGIMSRVDQLKDYRAAIGNLEKSARRDPGRALCLNAIALESARFTLAAAKVPTGGLVGAARTQGFVLMMAQVLAVWREDTDPDLSRTMAALDRALERAEDWSHRADKAARAARRVAGRLERLRWRRSPSPAPTPEPVTTVDVAAA